MLKELRSYRGRKRLSRRLLRPSEQSLGDPVYWVASVPIVVLTVFPDLLYAAGMTA